MSSNTPWAAWWFMPPPQSPVPESDSPDPPAPEDEGDVEIELENDLRLFFEYSTHPMIVIDSAHTIVELNEAAALFLRQPFDDLLGAPLLEIGPLARLMTAGSILQKLKTDPPPVVDEVAITDTEGQGLQCRIEAVRVAGERTLLTIQDTTAILRARQSVQAADRMRRALFDSMLDVAWTMALPEERLLEINPAVERVFGHQPAAFRENPDLWTGLVHPSDRERVRAEFRNGLATQRPFDIHFTGIHRNHRDLPHLVNRVVPVPDENGWQDRCEGVISDHSARNELEQKLRASDADLHQVLESVSSGVLVIARGERGVEVRLCNRRLAHMLQLPESPRPGTLLAKAPAALRAIVGGARSESELERRLDMHETLEDVVELEEPHRVLRRYESPIRDRFGAVISHLVAVEDVTPTWLLQQRLTQAQKMESMGRLAGGVAHDFNNLLGSVLGFGSLLLDQTSADDPRREGLTMIVQAAERAARLTTALIAFSRSARFERKPVRLNEVVEQAYRLLRSTLDPAIGLELRLDPALPSLLGDAQLLQQVIVSLVQEAGERLPGEGALRIVTRTREEPAPLTGVASAERQRMIELEVSAPNAGPPVDVPERKGAFVARTDRDGLALSIADDIARAHGGALLSGAEANPALFVLRLPTHAFDDNPSIVPEAPAARGHETILVVDDEPGLRALAKGGLTQLGFDVITAASGEEALGILRSRPNDVAAVLLDLSMPGLSGERVLRTIRDFQPNLPVIIASGYATVESQESWRAAGAQDFVAKPYRIADVALKLREIIDRSHGPVS